MIVPSDVMPLLLEAAPSFTATWSEMQAENVDNGERLHYLDAGDFIRHLVTRHLAKETDEFPAVFAVIERLVTEGTAYVRTLGVIGYLEGFQMATVTSAGVDPEKVFRPLTGPVSERWWARINQFWEGDHDALKVDEP